MVVSLSSIRNTIQDRIFNDIGSDLTVQTVTTTYDKWGDKTETITSTDTFKAVPYNTMFSIREYTSFGTLQKGETDVVVPYTANLETDMKVVYNNNTYTIQQIEELPYQGGNIAYVVRLRKVL